MGGLEGGEVGPLAAFGQRAGGLHVGQEHLAAGIEDFGGLGHEVDAAEDDDVRRGLLGTLGEGEAVAHVVGEGLDLVALVVMAEDDGVLFFLQAEDFLAVLLIGHTHKRF